VTSLVAVLRTTDPAKAVMETLPTKPSGDNATLLPDTQADAPILTALRSFGPPATTTTVTVPKDVAPSEVAVKVLNGSGKAGLASVTLAELAGNGFHAVDPAADADRADYATTQIHYAPGAQHKAELVAAYLHVGTLVAGGTVAGSDVTVVLGRDFKQVSAPGG